MQTFLAQETRNKKKLHTTYENLETHLWSQSHENNATQILLTPAIPKFLFGPTPARDHPLVHGHPLVSSGRSNRITRGSAVFLSLPFYPRPVACQLGFCSQSVRTKTQIFEWRQYFLYDFYNLTLPKTKIETWTLSLWKRKIIFHPPPWRRVPWEFSREN